jgi:D-3-phosphoglycerate dehydrogenase
MKTVVFSQEIHKLAMQKIAEKTNVVVLNNAEMTSFLSDLKQADGFVIRIGKVGREIIEQCPKLAVIARHGVGVDSIDVQAATEYGIPVVITPGANVRSVAEHTIALMYAVSKDIIETCFETKKGNFSVRHRCTSFELQGRKIGIVGFGPIGREVAIMMRNNGLVVSIYDPFVKKEIIEEAGYTHEKELLGLLYSVDILSLHVPLTKDTRSMIGAPELKAMKRGAIIINTARGGIINEDALYDAMTSGHIFGAGLDVMAEEPVNPQSKLLSLPNFIVTPHTAGLTGEAYMEVSDMVANGVLAILSGERWPHVFNPEVYRHPRWT